MKNRTFNRRTLRFGRKWAAVEIETIFFVLLALCNSVGLFILRPPDVINSDVSPRPDGGAFLALHNNTCLAGREGRV